MDQKNNAASQQSGQDNIRLARELIMKYRDKIAELSRELHSVKSQNSAKEEALALKKEPFYDDIEDVLDEVMAYASDHGISPREAYCALYAEGKAKKIISKNDKESKNIAALSSEGNKSEEPEDFVLSGEELWTAKRAGMSLADYLKYKTKG